MLCDDAEPRMKRIVVLKRVRFEQAEATTERVDTKEHEACNINDGQSSSDGCANRESLQCVPVGKTDACHCNHGTAHAQRKYSVCYCEHMLLVGLPAVFAAATNHRFFSSLRTPSLLIEICADKAKKGRRGVINEFRLQMLFVNHVAHVPLRHYDGCGRWNRS